VFCLDLMRLAIFAYKKRLIILSVIQLSGGQSNIVVVVVLQKMPYSSLFTAIYCLLSWKNQGFNEELSIITSTSIGQMCILHKWFEYRTLELAKLDKC
jgi:hypothetical protein